MPNNYLSPIQCSVIFALAEQSLNKTEAAKRVFMSRAGIEYHIKKIFEATGKNPTCFYDLVELVKMAEEG